MPLNSCRNIVPLPVVCDHSEGEANLGQKRHEVIRHESGLEFKGISVVTAVRFQVTLNGQEQTALGIGVLALNQPQLLEKIVGGVLESLPPPERVNEAEHLFF
jgi:hypothetical protein